MDGWWCFFYTQNHQPKLLQPFTKNTIQQSLACACDGIPGLEVCGTLPVMPDITHNVYDHPWAHNCLLTFPLQLLCHGMHPSPEHPLLQIKAHLSIKALQILTAIIHINCISLEAYLSHVAQHITEVFILQGTYEQARALFSQCERMTSWNV